MIVSEEMEEEGWERRKSRCDTVPAMTCDAPPIICYTPPYEPLRIRGSWNRPWEEWEQKIDGMPRQMMIQVTIQMPELIERYGEPSVAVAVAAILAATYRRKIHCWHYSY
jgi:hypothetical protein